MLSNVFLFVYAHERTRDLDPQYYTKNDEVDVKNIRDYYKSMADSEATDMAGLMKADQEESARDEAAKTNDPTPTEIAPPTKEDFDEGANQAGDYDDYDDRYLDDEPSLGDAIAWLRHLHRFKGAVPPFMREVTYEAWSKIEDPRPGTIGEYARNQGRNT